MSAVVILTKALAEARMKARVVFPGADFLPGDPVPSGRTVYRANGETCTVLREYEGDREHLKHWWVVDAVLGGKRFEVLEWPPMLKTDKPILAHKEEKRT